MFYNFWPKLYNFKNKIRKLKSYLNLLILKK